MNGKRTGSAIPMAAALALYVAVVAAHAVWSYRSTQQTLLTEIDRKLFIGASAAKYILADDFHDRARGVGAVSEGEDLKNIAALSAFANRAGFAFVYTVVRVDGRIHITASNATAEELARGVEVRYFDPYDEASEALRSAFDAPGPVYTTYTDRWGTFRAAILPERAPGGAAYLSAAEFEISHVRGILLRRWVESILTALLLLLASCPAFFLYLRRGRRQAEALAAAHQRLLTVLDGIDAHIYVADVETCEVRFMNRKMVEDFGGNHVGEICWRAFRGADGPCPHCTSDRLFDDRGGPGEVCVWEGENPLTGRWYINYDRGLQWVDDRTARIQVALDITAMKETDRRRRRAEEALQKFQKMETIGVLAGGIAHDFNNILLPIIGFVEMMKEDVAEESPLQGPLNEVLRGALRAADLVKQILAFSRGSDAAVKPLLLQPVLKEAVKLSRATLPATIEMTVEIDPACPMTTADPTQIHQVIMNLITNSYHAMERTGGRLTVRLDAVEMAAGEPPAPEIPPGRYARLTVADTGPGMDPETLARAPEPYFTTKETGKGTGLGLSIVHGIIQNLGGHLRLESEPGRGTTVSVFLSVQPDRDVPAATETPAPVTGGTERILLVDDEAQIVRLEGEMLRRLGYRVEARTSSRDALADFTARPDAYDLVITDMTMPEMTGDRLAADLKKIRPDIKVILCTGFSEKMSPERARALGIEGFLMKPVVRAELVGMVRRVLDG